MYETKYNVTFELGRGDYCIVRPRYHKWINIVTYDRGMHEMVWRPHTSSPRRACEPRFIYSCGHWPKYWHAPCILRAATEPCVFFFDFYLVFFFNFYLVIFWLRFIHLNGQTWQAPYTWSWSWSVEGVARVLILISWYYYHDTWIRVAPSCMKRSTTSLSNWDEAITAL